MENTSSVTIAVAGEQSPEVTGISVPKVKFTVTDNLAPNALGGEKSPTSSCIADPLSTPSKTKRRGSDAPWQTYPAITLEVTTGYALRKRKAPPVVQAPSSESPKKRVRRTATDTDKPQKGPVPDFEHACAETTVEEGAESLLPVVETSSSPITATKRRVRKSAVERRRQGDQSAPAVATAPEGVPIAEGNSTKVRNLESPKSRRQSRKGKERASDSPAPSVTSVEIHHHNVLVLVSGNAYEDEWDSEAALDDELTNVEGNGEVMDEVYSDWTRFELTEDGAVVVPANDLLLDDKPVAICGCGRILEEEREKPSAMCEQPDPRNLLLGGFTDARFQQALRDKLEQQTVQDPPQDEFPMWPPYVDVTKYAGQFHEEIFAVTRIGDNICDLYYSMDNECGNCQRESRYQIQQLEEKLDMIFDLGLSALGMQGIDKSRIVGQDLQLLRLQRIEAREKRQKEEARYWELS